jgi:hypothetical protein
MTREATNQLLELIEEGVLDPREVVVACVKYMSEDEVRDMCECNEFLDEDSYYDEDDGQPSWEQEWEDFGECYE